MIRTLFAILALALAAPGTPTVTWKAEVAEAENSEYELVLTGQVRSGYYTHPMTDAGNPTTIELEPSSAYQVMGEAVESYVPDDYKGETVVTGKYVIRQRLLFSSRKATVKGAVQWGSCTGDMCGSPEDWCFEIPVKVPKEDVITSSTPEQTSGTSIWALILEAVLWGFAMLLTPCVFPMVPMTVSFFMKGSESPAAGRFKAAMYGLFIVLLYTVPICLIIGITWFVGGDSVTADIFNWLATHWIPNIIFFVVFMIFAASFFGAFEITLPSKWTNSADKNSDKKGVAGIFFLALTLVLVSFSCTGPIVGTVLIKSTQGEFWAPMITMLAFSIAFALPFTILALFPSLLKSLPKSGGWLNSVKVVLGFIEVALGFKFLSTADQTYHWHLLDREVYLAIWIVCFSLLGLYLLGKLHFKHDSPVEYISVKRLALSIAVFSFVVYMIPGMWGAPLKALSGYLPPMETQDFICLSTETVGNYMTVQAPVGQVEQTPAGIPQPNMEMPHGLKGYDSIDDALVVAKAEGKHVFVDFTGHGCVNCREMEARVWSDPEVLSILRDRYVLVALYTDDKTKLPESRWIEGEGGKVLKDVGRVNSYIARERFGVNAQPNYALLDADGNLLAPVRGYDLSIPGFVEFLNSGLNIQ